MYVTVLAVPLVNTPSVPRDIEPAMFRFAAGFAPPLLMSIVAAPVDPFPIVTLPPTVSTLELLLKSMVDKRDALLPPCIVTLLATVSVKAPIVNRDVPLAVVDALTATLLIE